MSPYLRVSVTREEILPFAGFETPEDGSSRLGPKQLQLEFV